MFACFFAEMAGKVCSAVDPVVAPLQLDVAKGAAGCWVVATTVTAEAPPRCRPLERAWRPVRAAT